MTTDSKPKRKTAPRKRATPKRAIEKRESGYLYSGLRNPEQWLLDAFGGTKTVSGKRVTHWDALGIPAYFAAIKIIAEDIATLPRHVYRKLPGGGRELLTGHPVERIVSLEANSQMSDVEVFETLLGHALAYSGGYAEIVWDGALNPRELWPMDPSAVTPVYNSKMELAYQYTRMNGAQVYLQPADVFHVHGLGYDGLTSYAVSWIAREVLGASIATQEFNSSFFGNGAALSGMIEMPAGTQQKDIDALKKNFEARHMGSANANKVGLIAGGGTWKPYSVDPEKSQLISTMVFQLQNIARLFRMPSYKIQDYSGGNLGVGNLAALQLEYVTDCLMPWIIRIEREITRKLISKRGEAAGIYVKHELGGRLRGDPATRVQYYRELFNIGSITIDEIREYEEMNPLKKGGDTHFVQANIVPIERALAASMPVAASPALPFGSQPQDPPKEVDPADDEGPKSDPDSSNRDIERMSVVVRDLLEWGIAYSLEFLNGGTGRAVRCRDKFREALTVRLSPIFAALEVNDPKGSASALAESNVERTINEFITNGYSDPEIRIGEELKHFAVLVEAGRNGKAN